ncbi:MAG: hypothetical protein ACR2QF_06965 [Geminicoccaceae bacterium]
MTSLIPILGGTMGQVSAGLQTGADPSVLQIASNPRTGSGLDLSPYPIPAETGPTVGVAVTGDDRQAFIDAWNGLPGGGGVIEIDRRLLFDDNTQNDLNGKDNVTVKGTTTDAGIAADAGVTTGSAFRALLEIPGNSNIVIRDIEIDATGQNIGCMTPLNTTNLWLARLWCHDIGGNAGSHPNAAIKGGGSGAQEINMVGCVIEDGFGTPADPSVRGFWTSGDSTSQNQWIENCVIEHNIIRNMGHTGFAIHADVGGVFLRRNSSYDNVGAGFKPESPSFSVATGGAGFDPDFDPLQIVATYELNYSAGNGFHGFQPECVGQRMFRNYVERQVQAFASFEDWRRTEIVENFCTNIEGATDRGAVFLDGSNTRDRTNNLIENNTFEAGTASPAMIHGVYVHPDHVDFSQGNPYVIEDNKIVGATGNDFESDNGTFDAYIAGDPASRVQNNNSGAPGTPVVLIRPSYAP